MSGVPTPLCDVKPLRCEDVFPYLLNCWYLVRMSGLLRFEHESRLWSSGYRLVAGVDEAGRGCLAGPVVAAACVLPEGCDPLDGVRDSKLTRREERSELVEYIASRALAFGLGAASRREIDALNIRRASVLAMRRALDRVQPWHYALVDGPLPPEFEDDPCAGIIDGDAVCPSIAGASIIAKFVRDELMTKLARFHPEYGWERNVGYGTPEHREALVRHGPTSHHRFSFRPVSQLGLPFEVAGKGGDA
jgi:ribonuclease HII